MEEYAEQGDFDVFFTLKGWLPEKLPVHEDEQSKLWSFIKNLNLKSYSGNSSPANKGLTPTGRDGRATSVNLNHSVSIRASSSCIMDPFVIIFAFKESIEAVDENNIDFRTVPYPVRIIDYKEKSEAKMIDSIQEEGATETSHPPQKLIKIKTYFSCG